MSGEFAVKVNEIVESLSDFFTNWGQAKAQANWAKSGAKQWAADQRNREQQAQQQAHQQSTQQAEPISRLGPGWADTTLGISIKPATKTSPTMAFYQKKYYILNNLGQWLTTNKRPVPDTMSSLLNQALEQT